MTIHYISKKDKKILTDERLILRHYGRLAKKVMYRLSELRAANSLNDIPPIPPPRRHKLEGNYKNEWGIDVSKNYRIVIGPYGTYDINNLETIKEIVLIRIEDYH